jgi:hypothetical protein
LNCLIECHGEQHYFPVCKFGATKTFLTQQKRDNIKKEYAVRNKILFVEIPFWIEITEVYELLRSIIDRSGTARLQDMQRRIEKTREIFNNLSNMYPEGILLYKWKTKQRMDEAITIQCFRHKTFHETPNNLLKGIHCPECMKEENKDE